MSQQHAGVSQEWICSDNFTCCHTEIEVAEQTVHLTQSQYTDTRLTSPSTDVVTPGARQGSRWSANFYVTSMTQPGKILAQARFEPQVFRSQGGCLNQAVKTLDTIHRGFKVTSRHRYNVLQYIHTCQRHCRSSS